MKAGKTTEIKLNINSIIVIEKINESYSMNREEMIDGLYYYFSINDKFDFEEINVDKEDLEKWKKCYLKLKNILKMLENTEDENNILRELEILEVNMDFLQRHVRNKKDKIFGV